MNLLHGVISLLLPVSEVGKTSGGRYGASNSKLALRSDMAADVLWHGMLLSSHPAILCSEYSGLP